MATLKMLRLIVGYKYEESCCAVRDVIAKIWEKSPEDVVASSSVSLNVDNVIGSCTGLPSKMPKRWDEELEKGCFGHDSWFMTKFKDTCVVGVADGAGLWQELGVDPSPFPRRLMEECEKLVASGDFDFRKPAELLDSAFIASKKAPKPCGSSTACILALHKNKLYSANLGDSGFMVIRDGKIISRSEEQVHDFNAPYQLSFPPPGLPFCIEDDPMMASRQYLMVKKGDIILLATDGIWNNVHDRKVLEQLKSLDPSKQNVQEVCKSLVLTAHKLSKDFGEVSPFKLKALKAGFRSRDEVPSDITSVVLLVT